MKVKLFVSEKNKKLIMGILEANNILIDETSSIAIAEDGCCDTDNYSIKIIFKENSIVEFMDIIRLLGSSVCADNIILGRYNETYTPIEIADISYFNAINNDTFANLANGKSYNVKKKLYQLEEELSSAGFFRINKSELVNMKQISLITPMFKGRLIINLVGYKTPFDISRGYTKAFKERLGF